MIDRSALPAGSRPWLARIAVGMLVAGLAATPASAQQRPAAAPAPQPQAPAGAPPGPIKAAVIAVVDIQLVMRDVPAVKGIRDQIEKQRSVYQAEISKRENELRAAEQDLGKQRSVLAEAAFNDRVKAFEQQVGEFQRQVNAKRAQLDQGFGNAMKVVEDAMAEVMTQVATERQINIIMDKRFLTLSANDLDVTRDVETRLAQKLPSVTVKLPPLQTQ